MPEAGWKGGPTVRATLSKRGISRGRGLGEGMRSDLGRSRAHSISLIDNRLGLLNTSWQESDMAGLQLKRESNAQSKSIGRRRGLLAAAIAGVLAGSAWVGSAQAANFTWNPNFSGQ